MNRKDFRPNDEISYKETKGKMLTGHAKDYDVYVDKKGKTYQYKGKSYRPYERAYIRYKKNYDKDRSFQSYEEFAESREKDRLELKKQIKKEHLKFSYYDREGKLIKSEKQKQYREDLLKNTKKYDADSKRISKTYHGYIIGRKLEDKGRIKNFTYYPDDYHGKPPYIYKTKVEALKHFNNKKKFPASESNAVLFKYTPQSYFPIIYFIECIKYIIGRY